MLLMKGVLIMDKNIKGSVKSYYGGIAKKVAESL